MTHIEEALAMNKKSNAAVEKIAHALLVLHKEYKEEHLEKQRPIVIKAPRVQQDWRLETKRQKLEKWNIHGPRAPTKEEAWTGTKFESHYKTEKKLEQEGFVKTYLRLDIRDKIDADDAAEAKSEEEERKKAASKSGKAAEQAQEREEKHKVEDAVVVTAEGDDEKSEEKDGDVKKEDSSSTKLPPIEGAASGDAGEGEEGDAGVTVEEGLGELRRKQSDHMTGTAKASLSLSLPIPNGESKASVTGRSPTSTSNRAQREAYLRRKEKLAKKQEILDLWQYGKEGLRESQIQADAFLYGSELNRQKAVTANLHANKRSFRRYAHSLPLEETQDLSISHN